MRSPEPIWSGPAAADYSAVTKPRYVVINSSGEVALVGTATIHMVGTSECGVAAGVQLRVNGLVGTHRVEAGSGGLAVGDKVASTNVGKGVVATADDYFAGVCVKAAADGEIAEVFSAPGYIKA
jgi:hypothetical protein